MATKSNIRVVGLHRVPFKQAAFEQDVQLPDFSGEELAAWRAQVRDNWDNAWLIVVAHDGPARGIDFDRFGHGAGKRENRQAPWMEQVIEDSPSRSLGAFFMHFVDGKLPLWYGKEQLILPAESVGSPELWSQMTYSAPD